MSEHIMAQWGFGGWGGGNWGGGPWWGAAPWWGLGTLVLVAGIVTLIVFLVRRSRWQAFARTGMMPQLSVAEDMLARRFAAGEITEEEYLSRLAVLRRPVQ